MSEYRSLSIAAWLTCICSIAVLTCICSIAVLIGGELLVGFHRYALGVVVMLCFPPIYWAACEMKRHANRSRV